MRRRHREEDRSVRPDGRAIEAAAAEHDGVESEASVGLAPEITILGPGAKFDGTLVSGESVRIDGRANGTIAARGDVILSSPSRVEADILAENVTVGGALKGTVTARTKTELAEGGRMFGSIRSRLLVVREGAQFSGQSSTGEDATGASDGHPDDELQTAYNQAKRRAAAWYTTHLAAQTQQPSSARDETPDRTTAGHVTARRPLLQQPPEPVGGSRSDARSTVDEENRPLHEDSAAVDR